MSDPKQPDLPPGDGADPGGMSEAELDSILADAAGLVSELTRQVGEPDATTAPAAAPSSPDPVKAVVGDKELDAELAKLDTLLSSAAGEVGADPSPSSPTPTDAAAPTPSPVASAPPKPAPRDIPDFMQEFTQPDASDAAPSRSTPPKPASPAPELQKPAAPHAVSAEPVTKAAVKNVTAEAPTAEPTPAVRAAPGGKPGVVGTGMLGVVASPVTETAVPRKDDPAPTNGETASGPPAASEVGNPPPIGRRVLKGVEPLLIKVAEKGVGVMERVDRPFARLGGSVRRYLGLAALATLATALIVLVISSL